MSKTVESVLKAPSRVNVAALLKEATKFGPNEVELLRAAVSSDQISEVRQQIADVREELDGGEKSKLKSLIVGITFYMLGRHEVAEGYLSKLSGDGFARYYHGQVLTSLGRPKEAAVAFEEAGKLGHDPVGSLLAQAGCVRAGGDHALAEKLLKLASQQGGATRADYSYEMGCLLSDRGDTYGAIEYFERAVDMQPHHTRALFWLAGENALHGIDDEAVRLYERALSKAPLHLSALINLGLLYEDMENYQAAAFCFRRVLDIDPSHVRAELYLRDIDAAHNMYYDEDTLRNQARMKQTLEIPVTDFELSVRSRNCLQKMGVRNLGDLTRISEAELLAGKNFGETSLQEIKQMMESKGLRLGETAHKDRARDFAVQNDSLTPQQQTLVNRPVSELNLSVRARKCMARLGIASIGELIMRTPDELLESKNFGVTSLNEVRQKLNDLGFRLRND